MGKDVSGKGSRKEEFLALIFVLVWLVSFVFVAYVDANWEKTSPEEVLTTDINLVPVDQNAYGKNIGTIPLLQNHTSSIGYKSHYATPHLHAPFNQTELMPLSTGNNTWTMSIPTLKPFPTGDMDAISGANGQFFVVKIPNLDDFLLHSAWIKVNFTKTIKLEGFTLAFGGYVPKSTPINRTSSDTTDYFAKEMYTDTALGSVDDLEYSINFPLNEAIDLYQNVQEFSHFWFYVQTYDDTFVGHDDLAIEYQIVLNGTYQQGISTVGLITLGLGASTFINVLVGLFMTDAIDLAKIRKAVRRRG